MKKKKKENKNKKNKILKTAGKTFAVISMGLLLNGISPQQIPTAEARDIDIADPTTGAGWGDMGETFDAIEGEHEIRERTRFRLKTEEDVKEDEIQQSKELAEILFS